MIGSMYQGKLKNVYVLLTTDTGASKYSWYQIKTYIKIPDDTILEPLPAAPLRSADG